MDDDALIINVTDTTEFHQDVHVDTDPSPNITAPPPTAEHISSFLLHIHRRATDTTGDPVLGVATPADTAADTSRGHTQNNASVSGPGDDVAGDNVAVAIDITADESDVTADNTGNVDTGDRASDPPTDMAIGDTNNPTGIDGTMPMGPSK